MFINLLSASTRRRPTTRTRATATATRGDTRSQSALVSARQKKKIFFYSYFTFFFYGLCFSISSEKENDVYYDDQVTYDGRNCDEQGNAIYYVSRA